MPFRLIGKLEFERYTMKLFYFTGENLSRATGPSAHVLGMVCALQRSGWEITVLSTDDGTGAEQPRIPCQRILVKKTNSSLVHQCMEQIRLLWQLLRGTNVSPDAIYVRFANTYIIAPLYAMWRRIPYFLEINGLTEIESSHARLVPFAVKMENWILRRAVGVFPVTPELRDYLVRRSGAAAKKFVVVPNGCDRRLCKGEMVPEDDTRPTIGFLGSLAKSQGVETVLKAFPSLKKELVDLALVVAGEGPLKRHYCQLVERLSISHDVCFPGAVRRDEIPSFVAKCSVMVAPYVDSTRIRVMGASPLKVFTYLACGRIVVTSDMPALQQAFGECPAVFYARADDPMDYSRAIMEVMRMDAGERTRLGLLGRQFVAENHTWDILAGKVALRMQNSVSPRASGAR